MIDIAAIREKTRAVRRKLAEATMVLMEINAVFENKQFIGV